MIKKANKPIVIVCALSFLIIAYSANEVYGSLLIGLSFVCFIFLQRMKDEAKIIEAEKIKQQLKEEAKVVEKELHDKQERDKASVASIINQKKVKKSIGDKQVNF